MDPESNTRLKGKLLQKAWANSISQLLRFLPSDDPSISFIEHLQRPFGIDELVRFFEEVDFSRLVASFMDLDGDLSPEDFAHWVLNAEVGNMICFRLRSVDFLVYKQLPEKLERTGFIQRTSLQFLDLRCVDTRKISLGFQYQDAHVDPICCGGAVKVSLATFAQLRTLIVLHRT
jgi:hypothetical protein